MFFRVITLLLFSGSLYAGNTGHRLCGDLKVYEDNSIKKIEDCAKLQKNKKFKYWETDLRETRDGEIVLHHDDDYYGLSIKNNTLKQLKTKLRRDGSELATLIEFLDAVEPLATKPIMLETKLLLTDKARYQYLATQSLYPHLKIEFLSFPKAFKKSFPNRSFWCPMLKVVKRAGLHRVNLCQKYR